jgi:formate-dependent nitrite reductase membrane component NrfD
MEAVPTDTGSPELGTGPVEPVPGYHDIPMLKPPVWTDMIAWYFFLGGLSGGAYVTARLAERIGGPRFRGVGAVGTGVAALAALPCAPLLIADLGDPKRFHHMLRVFKPESPMNLGSWVLTGYHGCGAAALAHEFLRDSSVMQSDDGSRFLKNAADGLLAAIADVGGIPLALLLTSYTGVLLTGGSVPVWCKSTWLPALFAASAFSSGSAAISLAMEALDAAGVRVGADVARLPLETLHTAAHLAEVVTLVGYLSTAGKPLLTGKLATRTWGVLGSIAASEMMSRLPAGPRASRWLKLGATALSLYSAYSLRSAILQAGGKSARNPNTKH